MITLESYGQHGIRDCESTLDRVTNWLYLFLIPLASFHLLQYYTRLGGGGLRDSRIVSGPMEGGEGWVPRQSHNLRTNGRRGGGLCDSRIVSGLKRFSLGLFGLRSLGTLPHSPETKSLFTVS